MNAVKRTAAFTAILLLLLAAAHRALRPVWYVNDRSGQMDGFYAQPANTVEAVFLGSSEGLSSFSPMEMYEESGICAYNLCSANQSAMMSYYLLRDAHRKHPRTLKAAVYDVTGLYLNDASDEDGGSIRLMRLSPDKLRAVRSAADTLESGIGYLSPVYSFHSGWKNMNKQSFFPADKASSYTRGYVFTTENKGFFTAAFSPVITDSAPCAEGEYAFDPMPLKYLRMMAAYCSENGIRLILAKGPLNESAELHKALSAAAVELDADILDINHSLYNQTGINVITDFIDYNNVNFFGAEKISRMTGRYLSESCGLTDVRGQEKYAFMETQLTEYRRHTRKAELMKVSGAADYIAAASAMPDTLVIASVKNNGVSALDDRQRETAAALGLTKLSELKSGASWLCVMDGGRVVAELAEAPSVKDSSDVKSDGSVYSASEGLMCAERDLTAVFETRRATAEVRDLSFEGRTEDGTDYSVKSGGKDLGNTASCFIGGSERAPCANGINIAVWDKKLGELSDAVCFTSAAYSARSEEAALADYLADGKDPEELKGTLRELYMYNTHVSDVSYLAESAGDHSIREMFDYLGHFNNGNYILFFSVRDDGAGALDDASREILREMGFEKFAALNFAQGYAAVKDGQGQIIEAAGEGSEPVRIDIPGASVISGGYFSGDCSSVLINGTEYSPAEMGVNVTVYNKMLGRVTDSRSFNTSQPSDDTE